MSDDRLTPDGVDKRRGLFHRETRFRYVGLFAVPEVAIECLPDVFDGSDRDKVPGEMGAAYDGASGFSRDLCIVRGYADVPELFDHSKVALGAPLPEFCEGSRKGVAYIGQPQTEHVEHPGAEGDFELDAGDQSNPASGCFFECFRDAFYGIVVRQGQNPDRQPPCFSHELGWGQGAV